MGTKRGNQGPGSKVALPGQANRVRTLNVIRNLTGNVSIIRSRESKVFRTLQFDNFVDASIGDGANSTQGCYGIGGHYAQPVACSCPLAYVRGDMPSGTARVCLPAVLERRSTAGARSRAGAVQAGVTTVASN
jgi:hypothetical protein